MSGDFRIRVTNVEVSDAYCSDILVTCVEGGSNYWASFRNVVRDAELNILECEVLDLEGAEGNPEEDSTSWKKITLEDIRKAVAIAVQPEFEVGNLYKEWILCDNNDAESSDILLQTAMFSEVLYS